MPDNSSVLKTFFSQASRGRPKKKSYPRGSKVNNREKHPVAGRSSSRVTHEESGSLSQDEPSSLSRSSLIEDLESRVDLLCERLQDSESTIREQHIQLLKYRADLYANHQTPDIEIKGKYQNFIGVATQVAGNICDATGYNTNVVDSVISRMMNEESRTVTELKALSGLLKSPSYSRSLHRSAVAMVLFLSVERWVFPPRCFSTGISRDENGSFSDVLDSFLADMREDNSDTGMRSSCVESIHVEDC